MSDPYRPEPKFDYVEQHKPCPCGGTGMRRLGVGSWHCTACGRVIESDGFRLKRRLDEDTNT
jgi:ribosomal protein L37AE/L43A